MSKKKKTKNIFKDMKIESVEPEAEITEPVPASDEAIPPDEEPGETTLVIDPETAQADSMEESDDAQEAADEGGTSSAQDALDDVRRSLMESESEEQKKPSWWQRLRKGKKGEAEVPEVREEIDLPIADMQVGASDAPVENGESQEYLEQIDELINMLEPETTEDAELKVETEAEAPPEPVKPVDIEELKKQAFRPRVDGEETESFSEVRTIALDGGEEVFVEVDSKPQDPLEERLSAFENSLRPYRRYIFFLFAFIGMIAVVITLAILWDAYKQTLPPPPTPIPSNLPFPTSVGLPGGLNFNLRKGSLQNEMWDPGGPEWLEGTEICRWVAIPWSRQLEAAVRTMTQNDSIGLVMSNGDVIEYQVYSIREMSFEEMQELDSGSPCLLLILAKQDSEKRWVVTALP
jgi:hypothetical protein